MKDDKDVIIFDAEIEYLSAGSDGKCCCGDDDCGDDCTCATDT